MRHKYATRALVLARTPIGEANGLVTVLTADLGLVRARAQSVRRPGAKLAAALATYAESDVVLVRGLEGWRLTGAALHTPHFVPMGRAARLAAARITSLVLRLAASEVAEPKVFELLATFFATLPAIADESLDAAEVLAALSILSALGHDAGEVPAFSLDPATLAAVAANRRTYILRINRGLEASGL